jgi:hypothetical protein
MRELFRRGPENPDLDAYMQEVQARHESAVNGELYADSPLHTWEEEQRREADRDISLGGFIVDMIEGAAERMDNMDRWERGDRLPPIAPGMSDLVRARLPRFVAVNPEAGGGLSVERARRFKIDRVTEDIINEAVIRLPRRMDAYHYRQGEAADTVEIPGVGPVTVTMRETGGVFTYVTSIDGPNWRVWNCRPSGVQYLNRYNDISLPSEVSIDDGKTKLNLYDEDGIYIHQDGKRYTNVRWKTRFGRGYDSDAQRDDLHRTYNGGSPGSEHLSPGEAPNKDWDKDKKTYSWETVQDEAIVWLAQNVLFPLRAADVPESQATERPEKQPFPHEKIGPLFTYVETRDLERIQRIQQDPSRAYPDEQHGIGVGYRLVSLGDGEPGLPSAAYDGYVYARQGQLTEATDLTQINRIGRDMRRTGSMLGGAHGFAQLRPKHGDDVFVVDWVHARQSSVALARTMTPVNEYDGSFEEPIIIFGRDIELDEISYMFPAPPREDRRRSGRLAGEFSDPS